MLPSGGGIRRLPAGGGLYSILQGKGCEQVEAGSGGGSSLREGLGQKLRASGTVCLCSWRAGIRDLGQCLESLECQGKGGALQPVAVGVAVGVWSGRQLGWAP